MSVKSLLIKDSYLILIIILIAVFSYMLYFSLKHIDLVGITVYGVCLGFHLNTALNRNNYLKMKSHLDFCLMAEIKRIDIALDLSVKNLELEKENDLLMQQITYLKEKGHA